MIVVALVWLWVRALEKRLTPSSFATGYLMLAAVLFLALYNVRKKLPFLPLGSSAAWLQWHLYVGIGSVGVFALHAGLRWPTGILETALAAVYLLHGDERTRRAVSDADDPGPTGARGRRSDLRADSRVASAGSRQAGERGARIGRRIRGDDAGRFLRRAAVRLLPSWRAGRGISCGRRRRCGESLMDEMQDLRRYLSEHEQAACERLFALVRRKDDLDFHGARQAAAQDVAVRAYRADVRARGAGDAARAVGDGVSRRCRVREPAPDYSTSQYERPNQPWVCGLAEHGHACPAGPTARGAALPWPSARRCATATGGSAIARRCAADRATKGRRRRAAAAGCHRCRPVRSLRAMRGRFVAACDAVGGRRRAHRAQRGLARPRHQAGAAGPAARAIAGARTAATPNCGACHAAAAQNVAGWAASLVVAHDDQPTQSQLCMNCHAKTISTELALAAHNLPAERIGARSCQGASRSAIRDASSLTRIVAVRTLVIASITGRRFDLTAIDNAACQACHQQRYESFADGPSGFRHLAVRAADADRVQSCVASGQTLCREEAGV